MCNIFESHLVSNYNWIIKSKIISFSFLLFTHQSLSFICSFNKTIQFTSIKLPQKKKKSYWTPVLVVLPLLFLLYFDCHMISVNKNVLNINCNVSQSTSSVDRQPLRDARLNIKNEKIVKSFCLNSFVSDFNVFDWRREVYFWIWNSIKTWFYIQFFHVLLQFNLSMKNHFVWRLNVCLTLILILFLFLLATVTVITFLVTNNSSSIAKTISS